MFCIWKVIIWVMLFFGRVLIGCIEVVSAGSIEIFMFVFFEDDLIVFYGNLFLGGCFEVFFFMWREDLVRYVGVYGGKGIDFFFWDVLVNGVVFYDS